MVLANARERDVKKGRPCRLVRADEVAPPSGGEPGGHLAASAVAQTEVDTAGNANGAGSRRPLAPERVGCSRTATGDYLERTINTYHRKTNSARWQRVARRFESGHADSTERVERGANGDCTGGPADRLDATLT